MPREKPARATDPGDDAGPPEQRDAASDETATPDERLPDIETPKPELADLKACEADLERLGVVFERQEAIIGENGCGIVAPYSISEIANSVTISPAASMRCPTALSLARWVGDVVMPSTEAFPDDIRLSEIRQGSTYVCRRRNNSATGKMSEHSIGNAIDVMGFGFEGREPIPVSPRAGDGTMEEAFQRAVRAGACLHFTTVLGPGSDGNHNDHLHLDIIERSSGYRLCQ
ncbi:MAG: extensin family protein [Hoeflea sp.]|uniref:extensin-like domain-containing protein n=1 Tax=Hoeflea sp. TaxID=1940281 RepID=UPI0032EFD662